MAASEILNYVTAIQTAVVRLQASGCSETEISFQSDLWPNSGWYNNPNSPADNSCNVFHPDGGGAIWMAANPDILDQDRSGDFNFGNYAFTRGMGIFDIGTSAGEVVLAIPYLRRDFCLHINEFLGNENDGDDPPQDIALTHTGTWVGDFVRGDLSYMNVLNDPGDLLRGKHSGCFESDGSPAPDHYHFYHVLIAR